MAAPDRHWLLEVELDGRVYRWAVEALEVTTDAGDVLVYNAGLKPPRALAEGDDEAKIEIDDESVDWVELASELEGRPCLLARWAPGTVREEAVVFVRGEARGTSAGARYESVGFTIQARAGSATLGVQIPDPLAVVDSSTWPPLEYDADGEVVEPAAGEPAVCDEGSVYPWIFGYPGYDGTAVPIPVVPIPLGQWCTDHTETLAVVNLDADAVIESVHVRNDDMDQEGTLLVSRYNDSLGRPILVADFDNDPTLKPATRDERATLFAGFHPNTGGGSARSAYDVIVQVLRVAGRDATDWARIPEIRDAIGGYLVDTYLDDPATSPWEWLDDAFLGDLPVAVRVSERGRYLVERRYVPTGARLVGAVTAGAGAERTSRRERDSEAGVNEYVASYRMGIDEAFLARLVVNGTGKLGGAALVAAPPPGTTQLITVQRNGLCAESLARFGLRQSEPLEIDWSWDTGTIARVVEWMAQRDAIPPWLVEYSIENGDELREGDELELTDAELGWSGVLALVDAPPVVDRTRWASVSLRIPCG